VTSIGELKATVRRLREQLEYPGRHEHRDHFPGRARTGARRIGGFRPADHRRRRVPRTRMLELLLEVSRRMAMHDTLDGRAERCSSR
jgi:hypothetical protein